jgi:hypothetical protein
MTLRHAGAYFVAISVFGAMPASAAISQAGKAQAGTATQATAESRSAGAQAAASSRVRAELVKGKLSPESSKPGDQITARIKEDVKSNGQVVLKKGSEITGVVRSVKRADAKAQAKGDQAAQSMMQVEWLTPPSAVLGTSQQLNVALQSVAYTDPLYTAQQVQAAGAGETDFAVSRPAPARSGGGGLLGGGLAGATGPTLGTLGDIGAGGAISPRATAGAASQTDVSLLAATTIAPVSVQTGTSLESSFGVSSNQLLVMGHGRATSSQGSTASIDLFSHMSNDTVITSPSRSFEIGTGAMLQFMVSAITK